MVSVANNSNPVSDATPLRPSVVESEQKFADVIPIRQKFVDKGSETVVSEGKKPIDALIAEYQSIFDELKNIDVRELGRDVATMRRAEGFRKNLHESRRQIFIAFNELAAKGVNNDDLREVINSVSFSPALQHDLEQNRAHNEYIRKYETRIRSAISGPKNKLHLVPPVVDKSDDFTMNVVKPADPAPLNTLREVPESQPAPLANPEPQPEPEIVPEPEITKTPPVAVETISTEAAKPPVEETEDKTAEEIVDASVIPEVSQPAPELPQAPAEPVQAEVDPRRAPLQQWLKMAKMSGREVVASDISTAEQPEKAE